MTITPSRTVEANTGPNTFPEPCEAKYRAMPAPRKANAGPAVRS
jgi:hypothetical protein